jgi:GNAT superfamily N-acetyltransferase
MSTSSAARNVLSVRRAKPEDAQECGRICYDAFSEINIRHGFPCDFPNPEVAVGLLSMMFSHPGFYAVVAEIGGKIVGSNCLDERSPIAGVGPITVDPKLQNAGAGRKLMEAVLDRAAAQKYPGVRLVQAAFHNRSLSLYAKLGFQVREFLSVMQGSCASKAVPGFKVRAAANSDVEECNRLCISVLGQHRGGELTDAVTQGTAVVAEGKGEITAYSTQCGVVSLGPR